MTAYPPQPPRRLTRSRTNKMVGGVCAGVANYLNMDVTLVRILTVVLSLFTGLPIIAYIVCLLVVPEEDAAPSAGPQTVPVPESASGPAEQPNDPVWGPQGAPWNQGPGAASSPTPSPSPGADPAEPHTSAPADPTVPPASTTDSDPLGEDDPVRPAPGTESAWESAPADPTDHSEEKKD